MGGIIGLPGNLDCRKLFARGEGEKLGENLEGDKSDNIPLMGLSSDDDAGDPSHNPDAWTPMNISGIELGHSTAATTTIERDKENPATKKHETEATAAVTNTNSFEVSFGKDTTFQNLDPEGFQVDENNVKNTKMPVTETSDTTASDLERETKPKGSKASKSKKSKGRKGEQSNSSENPSSAPTKDEGRKGSRVAEGEPKEVKPKKKSKPKPKGKQKSEGE